MAGGGLDDGVTAVEDAQGAELLEARGERREPAVGGLEARGHQVFRALRRGG